MFQKAVEEYRDWIKNGNANSLHMAKSSFIAYKNAGGTKSWNDVKKEAAD